MSIHEICEQAEERVRRFMEWWENRPRPDGGREGHRD